MPTLNQADFLNRDRQAREARQRSSTTVPFGEASKSATPIPKCCRASDPCMRCYRCEACCRCEGGQQDATPDGWKPRK